MPSANEVVLGRPLISSPSPYCAAAAPGTPGAAAADDDPVEDSVLFQNCQNYVLQDVLSLAQGAYTAVRTYVYPKQLAIGVFLMILLVFALFATCLDGLHTLFPSIPLHTAALVDLLLETHTKEHTGVGWECFNTQCHLIYSNTQSHALFPFFTLFFGC